TQADRIGLFVPTNIIKIDNYSTWEVSLIFRPQKVTEVNTSITRYKSGKPEGKE
ncbi:14251_t:CDS:1, partial [Ambispora leptoticha]